MLGIRALLPLICITSTGCVSVFEGTSQDISVNTNPAGATCSLEREGKSIGSVVNTPGTATVRKTKNDITVKCDKPGYETATYINHSGVSSAIAANVAVDLLLTAGISSIVDSANGADNKYEPVVNLSLVPVPQAQLGNKAEAQPEPIAEADSPEPTH
jgi:PEGA domain